MKIKLLNVSKVIVTVRKIGSKWIGVGIFGDALWSKIEKNTDKIAI